jgi:hypothetical protein
MRCSAACSSCCRSGSVGAAQGRAVRGQPDSAVHDAATGLAARRECPVSHPGLDGVLPDRGPAPEGNGPQCLLRPIVVEVIRILRGDYVRQQSRPRSSLLDRACRQDGLHYALLAARARVLRSHILADHERGRHVVQLLGGVRADPYLFGVAGRTVPLASRRHYFDAFAWQIGWQAPPAWMAPTERRTFGAFLCGRFVCGLGLYRSGRRGLEGQHPLLDDRHTLSRCAARTGDASATGSAGGAPRSLC